MTSNGTALVTGASGFIGGHIVEILHLTGAHKVRAGVRTWSSCARLGRFPVDMVRVDLLNRSAVARALKGVSCVVHCAQGPRDVIVQGTTNLLHAALESGVRRVVHLSSTAVYGNATGQIGEDFPLHHTGGEYADAKIDAEKVCFTFAERGLAIVILRPPIVYGPYSTDWTVNVSRALARGNLGTLGRWGNGKCNLLFVHDLFRAIMLSLQSEKAVGQVFNINGPDIITWNDYFRRIHNGLGLPQLRDRGGFRARLRTTLMAPPRAIGAYLRAHHMARVKALTARSALARRLLERAERTIKAAPSLTALQLFSRDAVYTPAKAVDVLGFTPRFDVDAGLRLTNEWIKRTGVLP